MTHETTLRRRTAGQKWLTKIRRRYPIPKTDPLYDTLLLASQALDRCEAAEECIRTEGVLVPGFRSPKANPAIAVKRDAETSFLRLCRALGIYEPEAED